MNLPMSNELNQLITRREMLARAGTGLGTLGLAGLLAESGDLQAASPAS